MVNGLLQNGFLMVSVHRAHRCKLRSLCEPMTASGGGTSYRPGTHKVPRVLSFAVGPGVSISNREVATTCELAKEGRHALFPPIILCTATVVR